MSDIRQTQERVGDGMVFDKDVPVPMSDGTVLRANVFRPVAEGRHPVVMAMGVYGKDVHFRDGFSAQWDRLREIYPGLDTDGSSGRFLRWEMVDPERWVPDGYVVVAVDSRGSGKSPGYLDPLSPVETRDYAEAIDWAGVQAWSTGKVGLLGVSYLATKQWQVAALQPKHLAAIVPWEGACDIYREWGRHGGIRTRFPVDWWPRQVGLNQHGVAETRYRDADTGERSTGPALPPGILAGNRSRHVAELLEHELDDAWYGAMTPDFSRIEVPLLSAANWGGPGLHLRGNIEGWRAAASRDKWLSFHIGTHFESFYLPAYIDLQKRFFERYLKGVDNGWERDQPPIRMEVRTVDGSILRDEHEWPLARTDWQRWHLDPAAKTLAMDAPATASEISFDAPGDGVDFATAPLTADTEFTGPVALRLVAASSTADMDIFATLRLFDPDGNEKAFVGAHEDTPLTRGWLRASHRKLDPDRSEPWRPWHSHDELQKLTPGETVTLDIEIWPTSIVVPAGWRLVLTLAGRDFEHAAPGRMLHDDPADRPAEIFGGVTTVHGGVDGGSWLLLPKIP
ncbi:MAG: CocE/NonD family hydrolase [Alphaproteobacteria bacterium]